MPLPYGPTDLDRDTSYYYTSGTTGKPKCVVDKEASLNAYLEMRSPCDAKHHYMVDYSEDGTTVRRKVGVIRYRC